MTIHEIRDLATSQPWYLVVRPENQQRLLLMLLDVVTEATGRARAIPGGDVDDSVKRAAEALGIDSL